MAASSSPTLALWECLVCPGTSWQAWGVTWHLLRAWPEEGRGPGSSRKEWGAEGDQGRLWGVWAASEGPRVSREPGPWETLGGTWQGFPT